MELYDQLEQQLIDGLNQFIQTVGAYLPKLLSAVVLLLLGLILAWGAKWLILRLGAGIDRMVQAIGIASLHVRLRWPVADILGWLIYWMIILFYITLAVEVLGFKGLSDWLGNLITYLPSLLLAGLFIFGGFLLGNTIRDRITTGGRSAGLQRTDTLGSWTRMIIILLAVLVGLAQIGIDVRLFEYILTIFVAALAIAIALAFGMGAGPTVSNIISARYVRKTYQVGQKIRINNLQGKILEMSSTGVVLDTDAGRTFIPARVFDEEASVLLDDESPHAG
ncbi:MAG: mechanosensitive ion channel [Gammaproteobacteria bacterium]|nr:mechanosensitive ion channel [Gammaproteobacteria bacterium]